MISQEGNADVAAAPPRRIVQYKMRPNTAPSSTFLKTVAPSAAHRSLYQVAHELPHWMANRRKPSYQSTSVIGELYDALQAHSRTTAAAAGPPPSGGANGAASERRQRAAWEECRDSWQAALLGREELARGSEDYMQAAEAALERFESAMLATMNSFSAGDPGEWCAMCSITFASLKGPFEWEYCRRQADCQAEWAAPNILIM